MVVSLNRRAARFFFLKKTELSMVECIKCGEVGTISKAGKVGKKQRYFCKHCNLHFTLPNKNIAPRTELEKKQNVTIKDIAEVNPNPLIL
jgi:transposase-like protein